MKVKLLTTCAILGATIQAQAGGIENTVLPIDQLFVEGKNVLHIGYGSGSGDGNGDYHDSVGGGKTGNGINAFTMPSLSYKRQVTEDISAVFAYHMPYEADLSYSSAGLYQGLIADWKSHSYSALVNYNLNNGFAIHGGVQLVQTFGNSVLPGVVAYGDPDLPNYVVDTKTDLDSGFIAGVSYSIPEIAFQVRLTYEAEIEHTYKHTETIPNPEDGSPLDITSTDNSTLPAAFTFSIESAVSETTLAWLSARHVEWKNFGFAPELYSANAGEDLIYFDHNTTSFELGMGHMLNNEWSVGGLIYYEKAVGEEASPAFPGDGEKALGLFAIHQLTQDLAVNANVGYLESEVKGLDAAGTKFKDIGGIVYDFSIDYTF